MSVITFNEIHAAITGGYFAPPKPTNELSEADIQRINDLESDGNLMIQRKDDGNGHLTVVGNKPKSIDIYTLGLNNATLKYPHIIKDLLSIKLPEKTIICNEISCSINGVQDRYEIGRLSTSGVENAKEYQRINNRYPEMSFFNPLVWNGEDVSKWSNVDRYECLDKHLGKKHVDFVRMIQLVEANLSDARMMVKKYKWEGLVLLDKNATTQFKIGKVIGMQPTIPRPDGIWKDKKGLEVDFVVYDFKPSTADAHAGGVKDFYIGLIDPETGELIPCGKVGNGLSKDDRFTYAKPGALPVAVAVEFEQWSKHGKTLIATIDRVRALEDKHFKQCVATEDQIKNFLSKERINPTW